MNTEEFKCIMLGLDEGGSTSLLYKIKIGETVNAIPTIGFNLENIEHNECNLSIFDVGGIDKVRLLWPHYYQDTKCVIFVIDSNDQERIEEAKKELDSVIEHDELEDTIYLILANKRDIPSALPIQYISDKLGLDSLTTKEKKWNIIGTSAITGEGLDEALDWVTNTLTNKIEIED